MKPLVLLAAGLLCASAAAQPALLAQHDALAAAIARQDAARVRQLIAAGLDLDLNFDDLAPRQRSFESPLTMAVYRGHLDIARVLIAGGASVGRADGAGRQPIHQARSAEAVALLLKSGADIEARDSEGRTAATNALERGDLAALDVLLAHGARLDPQADLLARALELAKPAMFDALLERGADPRRPPTRALWLLVESGDTERAGRLIAKGADPNARDTRGDSLLGRALFRRRWEIADALLEAGASTRSPDAMRMARQASFEPPMLARLTAKGLDLNATGANGHSALTSLVVEEPTAIRAVRRGAAAVVSQNAASGETTARLQAPREPAVIEIPAPDNLARVKALLAAGADPSFKVGGETPLMLAIVTPRRGAFEDPLIDAGGRIEYAEKIPAPDPKDPGGGRYGYHQGVLTGMSVGPLTWAALRNRPQVALRLVQRDRRIEPADRDLLYFAAALSQWELATGALPYVERKNVDAANGVGVTPLMLAARDGDGAAVRALLAAGARVNARSQRFWVSPDFSFLGALSGHSPRPPDLVGGYTPLRAAKERGHAEAARLLAEAGGVE